MTITLRIIVQFISRIYVRFTSFIVRNECKLICRDVLRLRKCLSFICVLAWMLLFACCGGERARQPEEQGSSAHAALAEIDSLMWRRADSAFVLLQEFVVGPEAEELDTFDGHYCQVLLSELLYKNDYGQSNREKLLKAVGYFDSIVGTDGRDAMNRVSTDNLVFLDARAHYINGVGFYEQGDVVEACEEYLKALEVMEERFEEEELLGHKAKFMTFSYGRLAELFSDQYMMENSIVCYENALSYCQRTPTSPRGVSRILFNIGHQYEMLNELKKALKYYVQATEHMPDTNHVLYRDIRAHIVICNYELGTDSNQSIEILRHNISQSEKESERNNYSLFIGSIYAEEKVYDSALVYLEPLFEHYGEIEAAKYLRVIYDSLGYAEKADECVRFLADNIQSEGENKALVSQLENVFKIYTNKKQQRQAEAEQKSAQKIAAKRTLAVAVSVALVVLAVLVWVLRKRSKKRLAVSETASRQELEAERQTHRMEQAAMSGRLKRSNQELRELKEQMKQQDNSVAKTEAAASFAEEPICRLILERVKDGQFKSKVDYRIYEDSALDKQQLLDLRLAVDRHFGQFTARLKKAYPELTNSDLDYCCLYLLGLTDADIAALMQRTYNTVFERKSKMRKIFGSDNPLPITLMGMAKDSSSI